jgi:hypothetical protein
MMNECSGGALIKIRQGIENFSVLIPTVFPRLLSDALLAWVYCYESLNNYVILRSGGFISPDPT